jgi:hypothetical protein
MPSFEESGLRVALPDEGSFRLSACRTYQGISGRRVSEMDFGWWDEAKQSISLLEIKDYSTRQPARDLLSHLVPKGRDWLVMLHAVWRDASDLARALREDLPEHCRTPQKLRLFFVLKVAPGGLPREHLPAINSALADHIQAYAELLGIRGLVVLLLDHEKAIEKGLPITVL